MDKSPDNQNKKTVIEAATTTEPLGSSNNDAENTNLKRRRALIAGLAAIPVLLTLKSQSALAQTTGPTPCSIILSINLDGAHSQHPGLAPSQAEIDKCIADNPGEP
jgi:hypothetical protein